MNHTEESKKFLQHWFPEHKALELASIALAQKFEEAELCGKEKMLYDENLKIILDAKKALIPRMENGYPCSLELEYIDRLQKLNSKKEGEKAISTEEAFDAKLYAYIFKSFFVIVSSIVFAFLISFNQREIASFFAAFSVITFLNFNFIKK